MQRGNPMINDLLKRPLKNLRISVTDRCNFRCNYCMPEKNYSWLPKQKILSFEEIGRLAKIFSVLGVEKIRLTGGEPLLRRDLPLLIKQLSNLEKIKDIALTTNGSLLSEFAEPLKNSGLNRLTISLDTLCPEKFYSLTKRRDFKKVLRGIEATRLAGFNKIKLNMVVINDFNQDEICRLLKFSMNMGIEIRFIEYMDVGGATLWSGKKVFSRQNILKTLYEDFGEIKELRSEEISSPAKSFYIPSLNYRFGIIASTTMPFCGDCDRSRITADGLWFHCLYDLKGFDLKSLIRKGASDQEILFNLQEKWSLRNSQGALNRYNFKSRGILAAKDELNKNPHLEMHVRGG